MESIKATWGILSSRAGNSGTSGGDQEQSTSSTSQSTPSRDIAPFPGGVRVWEECPGALVDICFVHGLSGDRESTWTAHGQSKPWPAAFLPTHLSNARLLTYGYDSYVVRRSVASTNRLLDHATNLLNDLTNERQGDVSSRPLIFVAHSLGGLVCKEAILQSRNHPELHLRGIFECVSGIIFMGTPHRGSWIADWAKIPVSALGPFKSTNKKLLAVLETDDQFLESIQDRFLSMIRGLRESDRRVEVTCFFEELPLLGVGLVVPQGSASFAGYTSLSIHANHSDMVKIRSPDENSFKRVKGELLRWEQSIIKMHNSQRARAEPLSETAETAVSTAKPTESSPRQAFHNIAFPQNRYFVGRMSTIDVLKQKMFEDDAAAAAQRVAIVGLGGVGKTQVALQMAYWTRQNKPDWSVFWVPLLSKETFEQAYRQIAQLVGLEEADKADIKFSVQRYLQSKESGRWLLIVDNADDEQVVFGDGKGMSGINEFLPQSDCGRFLLTTRLQRIATRFARGDVVELSKMEKSEAHAFLEKSLVDKTLLREADKVAKLLETLTYLPLAIIQAVSYLNENKESIDEYIRLLGKTEQDMVELLTTEFADDTRYGNTPNAVANTWVVSFEQIRKDADAAEILLFMAYIEPKAIPRSMLPEVGSEQRMTRAIGLLCGYSFLSRRKDEQLYDMHRLVHIASQLWVKRRVDAEKRRRTALEHLVTIFQTDKWEDRQRWQQYMPHVLKAIERSREEGEWQREERYLGYWMGRCLGAEGRIGEAVNLLEHVVAVDEGTLPDSDPVRLVSQHVLAVAYLEHGRVKDAISLLVHVVAAKETLEESNPNQLASQTMLAEAYLGDGRVKEAISLLELVVTAGAILRESHPDRLVSQHLLARAYLAYGRVKEAISLLELVVTARAILRESHPDRLMSQNDLAGAYLGYGRVKEAMNLLEKVVSVCKTTLAESHSVRLVSHNMLAMIYLTNGRVKEATNMLEYVVAVRRKTLLESHPVLLVSQDGLARAYVKSGRVKEAIDLLKEVVAVRRRTQAESHPDRQTSERRLAQVIEACS